MRWGDDGYGADGDDDVDDDHDDARSDDGDGGDDSPLREGIPLRNLPTMKVFSSLCRFHCEECNSPTFALCKLRQL